MWLTRLRDRLIRARVSHAAKVLRKHQKHHKHVIHD